MKVVMLSSDPSILRRGSGARKRMERYAELFSELHIFVLGADADERVGSRLFLYGTGFGAVVSRLWMYRRLCTLLSQGRFDAVSAQSPDEVGLIGYFASRRFGVPFQLQVHADVLSPWYCRASWKERVRYRIACFLLPRARCIRVVSARIRDSVVRRFPAARERIAVLPIFADLVAFRRAVADGAAPVASVKKRFRMCAAGRFVEKEKNFLMLIRMMAELRTAIPEATLSIIGDGPDRLRYERAIARFGLGGCVILEEWRSDIHEYFRSFDVFLLSSYHEGWGRVVLEAMAAGLPVVMTDVGLAGEVVKSGVNGIVIPVNDRDAFRSAVEFLSKDPELRAQFSRANVEVVRSFPSDEEEYLLRYRETFTICF